MGGFARPSSEEQPTPDVDTLLGHPFVNSQIVPTGVEFGIYERLKSGPGGKAVGGRSLAGILFSQHLSGLWATCQGLDVDWLLQKDPVPTEPKTSAWGQNRPAMDRFSRWQKAIQDSLACSCHLSVAHKVELSR